MSLRDDKKSDATGRKPGEGRKRKHRKILGCRGRVDWVGQERKETTKGKVGKMGQGA